MRQSRPSIVGPGGSGGGGAGGRGRGTRGAGDQRPAAAGLCSDLDGLATCAARAPASALCCPACQRVANPGRERCEGRPARPEAMRLLEI